MVVQEQTVSTTTITTTTDKQTASTQFALTPGQIAPAQLYSSECGRCGHKHDTKQEERRGEICKKPLRPQPKPHSMSAHEVACTPKLIFLNIPNSREREHIYLVV